MTPTRSATLLAMVFLRVAAPILLSITVTVALPATAQTSESIHDPRIPEIIHNLEKVKHIRETRLSPDASRIAWNITYQGIDITDIKDPAHPGKPRHVTACAAGTHGTEESLAWSPDSRHLAFFSDCTADHKTSIFIADTDTDAAPHALKPLDGYAKDLAYSPDGKFLSFLYVEGATRESGALAAMKPPSGVIGVEGLEVQRVAAVDAASGELVQITPPGLHVYEFDWSADSKELAYVAAPPPGENNWWVAKLYTQHAEQPFARDSLTFPPQPIFDPNTTSGPLHGLQIAVPRWSPDGKQIAFIGGLMSDQGATGGDLYVIPSAGRDPVNLTVDRHETASWISWTIPGQINYSAVEAGESTFRSVNLDSETPTIVHNNVLDFHFPATLGDGSLEMSLSTARGQFAFIKSSFSEPPEVWYVRDIGPDPGASFPDPNDAYEFFQITHDNDALKPAWGKSESVTWENEGFHVQGWLLYPANYDPSKKYPMIVMVHGGPSSAVIPRWPGAGFGGAPFSALGYFVLEPNPRGSYGEGEKFTAANRKDFGYGDLRDILAGVDAVTIKYPVDPERVGITGWSYGGFMTMFAVSQTNRFRAAVAGAGIANWQSYYGENSIDQWMIPFFGASVYDDPAVYAKSSAIDFIKQVKTPTLAVVGDRDGECPAPQSFEFWHALRDKHVPSELVVYPNEGHGFVDPAHRIDVLERSLAWFEQYMK